LRVTIVERTPEDHCTPTWILELVRAYAPIGLDPCSNPWSEVKADTEWSRHNDEDGLARSWNDHGLVYVNPPYSRGQIMPWVEKASAASKTSGVETIMLLPATPDTQWFERAFYSMSGLVFLNKRVSFLGAYPAGAKQPSTMFYWGHDVARFFRVLKSHGIPILAGFPEITTKTDASQTASPAIG
jgi:phage N-6-adenine-methyltransferase